MANVLAPTKDMDRDEWLENRKRGIGGSDAAAIAGLNKYKSKMAIYLEKIGAIESDPAGEAAYWGTAFEDRIAKEFKIRTGFNIRKKNAILQHPEYPFMLANIDREIVDKEKGRGVLEVKTTNVFRKEEWEGDKVPDEYMLQMQHYLAVTGYEYGYFAVLIGGQKFHHIEVERNQQIIDYLIQMEKEFWHLVETKTPPEMDGAKSSAAVLDYLYPPESVERESELELEESVLTLIEEYEKVSLEEKEIKEKKEEISNRIKQMMGEYEVGRVGDRKVSWKVVRSTRFDSKGLQSDHPDLYIKYAKESSYRRFTIS